MGSGFLTRDWTWVSCIGSTVLGHWTSREVTNIDIDINWPTNLGALLIQSAILWLNYTGICSVLQPLHYQTTKRSLFGDLLNPGYLLYSISSQGCSGAGDDEPILAPRDHRLLFRAFPNHPFIPVQPSGSMFEVPIFFPFKIKTGLSTLSNPPAHFLLEHFQDHRHWLSIPFLGERDIISPGQRTLGASLVAQLVKNLPAMQETPVRFLDPEMPGRLQFMGSKIAGHDWAPKRSTQHNRPCFKELEVHSQTLQPTLGIAKS